MSIIRKYIKTLTENIVFNGRKIENKDRINNVRHLGIVRFIYLDKFKLLRRH